MLGILRLLTASGQRKLALAGAGALAVICMGMAFAVPAIGHQRAATRAPAATRSELKASAQLAKVPTLSRDDSSAAMANLPVVPAKMTCAQLAEVTTVNGQSIQITAQQTASATPYSPVYCAVTGHLDTNIGFEILLPISTWRQRYLQVGCGGLCGSISINPNQTAGYQPLADGDFVIAAEDDGHSGNGTSWSTNPLQRVQFAYLSYHEVALAAKGLAADFYGIGPKYSYFDGCSQGGHEALSEAQRYPKDFNGILAGAPASIMTELNSVLHEYTYDTNYDPTGATILDQPEATFELNAALKACYPNAGLMLDYRACAGKFNLDSIECLQPTPSPQPTNCLTAAQIGVIEKVHDGPISPSGQFLYPGGYSLGSEFNWSNGTSANLPQTPGAATSPAGFITAWLQYFAFAPTTLTSQEVTDEPFTDDYFEQIEQEAPFWDATDPNLSAFQQAGGKLILWQGEADWSIPTSTSIAYYQAVVSAMGGLSNTQEFAKYYLLPSVGHCGGNGPDTYNGLGAVVSWAEKGVSPQELTATQYAPSTGGGGGPGGGPPPSSDLTDAVPVLGASPTTAVVRTLPLYPYPELPAYNGVGDVNDASSYYGKVSTAVQQPFPWLGKFDTTMTWCDPTSGLDCITLPGSDASAAAQMFEKGSTATTHRRI